MLRFRVFGCLRRFELHSIRYRILVIALDFCCIYIGLVFIKGRPVSSVLGASFSSFGCFVFDLGCFVFEFWVLRFRVLGASCFGLRFRVLRFRNYRRKRNILWLLTPVSNIYKSAPKGSQRNQQNRQWLFFFRPIIAHTRILVHRRGPRIRTIALFRRRT